LCFAAPKNIHSETMRRLLSYLLACHASQVAGGRSLRGVNESGFDRSDWLKDYSEILLTDLKFIPGTHNSGSTSPLHPLLSPVFIWAKNQWSTLTEQMNFGIRFLDSRVSPVSDINGRVSLYLSHHFITNTTLESALADIKSFLSLHPTEFIMLSVRIDYSVHAELSEEAKIAVIVEEHVDEYLTTLPPRKHGGFDSLSGISVKDVAGKVILISDMKFPGQKISWQRKAILHLVELWNESPGVVLRRVDEFVGRPIKPTFFFEFDSISHFFVTRNLLQYVSLEQHTDDGHTLKGIALDAYGAYGLPPLAVADYYNDYLASAVEANPPATLGLVLIDGATGSYVDRLFKVYKS